MASGSADAARQTARVMINPPPSAPTRRRGPSTAAQAVAYCENKFWWMYAPFDVPRLLGRPLEVSLTKDSGLAGLIFLIKQHLGLDLAKDDPRLVALHDQIAREFDAGRQTSIEWEELRPMVEYQLGNGRPASVRAE